MGISPEKNKEIGYKYQRARETKCRGAQTQEIWGGDGIRKAHVHSLRLVRKNEISGGKSRVAPHVWGTSHGQVEVERRLKVTDCVAHVPVFLALSDQMGDGDGSLAP